MSVAQNILEIVREHIHHENELKVRSIVLKIGELSGIVNESLEFCFATMIKDSPFSNVRLEIKKIPITAECKKCKTVSQLEYGIFFCDKCNNSDIELLTGRELQIEQIELDD